MKILLISRCPPYPLHLGDRLIPYHLARQLSARGHQIDLVTYYNQPDDPQQVGNYRELFRSVELVREPVRSGESYIVRMLNTKRRFPRRREESWSPVMWDVIQRHLANDQYDVVQLFGGIHVYEYRQLIDKLPNVIVPYESYSLYLERLLQVQKSLVDKLMIRLQLTTARRYEQFMFEGYGGVVVLSDVDRQALLRLNPNLPISVIPNGVDTQYFVPAKKKIDMTTLLFVGNYEYGPNLDAAKWLAQQILPKIKAQIPNVKLILVGNNPPESLKMMANSDVEITGRVADIRPYLEKATVFISPLRLGAGIKNKILEAMSMGKPLVATPLSCDGINLQEGENVLYGATDDELAVSTVKLLKDQTLQDQMAQANREFVETQFTWQHVADAYEMLYDKVRQK